MFQMENCGGENYGHPFAALKLRKPEQASPLPIEAGFWK